VKWTEAVAAALRCVAYDSAMWALDEIRWRAERVQKRLQAYGDRVGL
jgi:hypothetical protein